MKLGNLIHSNMTMVVRGNNFVYYVIFAVKFFHSFERSVNLKSKNTNEILYIFLS